MLIGIRNLSFAEFERSLSCHNGMFSSERPTCERMRASEDMRSLFVGFRFTGTALLPICPRAKYSATSPISVRCRLHFYCHFIKRCSNKLQVQELSKSFSSTICVYTKIWRRICKSSGCSSAHLFSPVCKFATVPLLH